VAPLQRVADGLQHAPCLQRAPVPCNTGHSLVVAGALERRHGHGN